MKGWVNDTYFDIIFSLPVIKVIKEGISNVVIFQGDHLGARRGDCHSHWSQERP